MSNKKNKLFLSSPVVYQGSKARECDIINKYRPKDFKLMVDAFGGGGAVSLYYIQRGHNVHYNEILKYLCELFTILTDKNKTQDFINKVNSIAITPDNFKKITNDWKAKRCQTVENYFILLHYAFRGFIGSGAINYNNKKMAANKDFSYLINYPTALRGLKISNNNALDVIEYYKDNPDVWIYCDPPYTQKGTSNVDYQTADNNTLIKLVEIIKNKDYKCRIMLHCDFSGFIYAELNKYLRHYYPSNFNITHNLDGVKYHKRYTCIITNYQ